MAAVAVNGRDSGFAWVVCGACFVTYVILGGFQYCPGMFYIMFKDGLDASDSALSFITSLNICIIFLVCPGIGFLTDRFGERLISLIGVGISTVALACCSFSTQVYHLYILYGVGAGVGMGMTYNSSLSIIPQYFNKYMRAATCITLCGLAVGSFIFPPIINALENQFGWRGAILIIAGINAQTLICCCVFRPAPANFHTTKNNCDDDFAKSGNLWGKDEGCLEKEECEVRVLAGDSEVKSIFLDDGKLYPQNNIHEAAKDCKSVSTVNQQHDSESHLQAKDEASNGEKLKILSLFKNVTFLCLLSLNIFINFPVGIVGTHFGNYVLTLGYTKADVVLLYMAWGISSTITRLMVGIFAQITHTNTALLIMCACILNGVLTILLPYTGQLWFLFVFAILYQLLLSFYNTLNISLLVESVGLGQASVAIGLSIGSCTPGVAIGPPLAAWLYGSTLGYSSSFCLSGLLLIMAGLTMALPTYRIYKLGNTKKNTTGSFS